MGTRGFSRLQLLVWGIFVSAVMFGLGFLTGSRWTERRAADSGPPVATHQMPQRLMVGPSGREIPEIPDTEVSAEVWEIVQEGESKPGIKGQPPPSEAEIAEKPAAGSKSSPPVASATTSGTYVVQVLSVQDQGKAKAYAAKLANQGYPAPKVMSAEIAGRGTWYRVRLGPFASEAEARKWVNRIRDREKLEPRLMRETD